MNTSTSKCAPEQCPPKHRPRDNLSVQMTLTGSKKGTRELFMSGSCHHCYEVRSPPKLSGKMHPCSLSGYVCVDRAIPEGRTAPVPALRRSRTEQQLMEFGCRSKTDPVAGTEFWTAHPGSNGSWPQQVSSARLGPAKTILPTVLAMRSELGQ